jgi:hypothetical protein
MILNEMLNMKTIRLIVDIRNLTPTGIFTNVDARKQALTIRPLLKMKMGKSFCTTLLKIRRMSNLENKK